VAPLGLAIYGLGWDRVDDVMFKSLLPHWKGVLPKDDIATLYSSVYACVIETLTFLHSHTLH
jgi:hypothetical protein